MAYVDISPLEMIDVMVEMLRNHPELCPHRMSWISSSESPGSRIKTVKYRCKFCGKEETVVMNKEDENYDL